MIVSLMQPSFLPWAGYFELILCADIFVFLDDFQFSVQSWHQRNRLFVNDHRVDWYTAPVMKKDGFKAPLNRIRLNMQVSWRQKFWKRICQNYAKAPYFSTLAEDLESWLFSEEPILAEKNIAFIRWVGNLLGFRGEFRRSSELSLSSARSLRVYEILVSMGARRYNCAKGSFGYMSEEKVFPSEQIEVRFQNFVPRNYPQVGSPDQFVPGLSILDALLNIGPKATREMVLAGTGHWLSWSEMAIESCAPQSAETASARHGDHLS